MNLPSKVVFSNGNKIEYVYDPFGIKRKQLISTYNSTSNTYSTITKVYVGSALYENGNIAYISNEEGVFQKSASTFVMQYSLKDHLGNLRMSLKADVNNKPIILQYDSYYPFGLEMGGMSYVGSTENKYKYNGKEKQDALGLGWYDYGARFYDPQIGRWLSPDPLAVEFPSWSPYNYVENNPIKLTDPDGRAPDIYKFDENGNYQGKTTAPGEHTGVFTGKNGFAFKFADPINDPKSIDEKSINKLETVSNSSIFNILKESGVYEAKNQNNKLGFILNESDATNPKGEGKMDYALKANLFKGYEGLPDGRLYLTETKSGAFAHNNKNFGNFLWGAGASRLGFSEGVAKMGAHYNNYFKDPVHKGTMDSKDDQKSIHLGYEWNKK
jgi:RHS repeat-associated protein